MDMLKLGKLTKEEQSAIISKGWDDNESALATITGEILGGIAACSRMPGDTQSLAAALHKIVGTGVYKAFGAGTTAGISMAMDMTLKALNKECDEEKCEKTAE